MKCRTYPELQYRPEILSLTLSHTHATPISTETVYNPNAALRRVLIGVTIPSLEPRCSDVPGFENVTTPFNEVLQVQKSE